MAETQDAAAAANRQCMTTALNNTIYKQQDDRDLEAALLAQRLDDCPADFIQSYSDLRNKARDYFAIGREVLAHQGSLPKAKEGDWWNLACSVVAGEQCAQWPSDIWNSENAELRARFETASSELESARRENEKIINGYGLYVRTSDAPSDNAAFSAPENAM